LARREKPFYGSASPRRQAYREGKRETRTGRLRDKGSGRRGDARAVEGTTQMVGRHIFARLFMDFSGGPQGKKEAGKRAGV